MTFAAPFFLIAAGAALIPVLLHLMHRQKAAQVHFSTLRFLRLSVQRTRRRKRLDELALLAVRAAALLLLAVGLAKPALTSLRLLGGRGAATAVAIILDNSASMAVLDQGQPRFDMARHGAEQVLDLLRDGDSVALFLTGGPPLPEQGKLWHTHETIRQVLAQCSLSYERADLAGKLQQARALLAEADATRREIYILTDNQALSWEGLKEDGFENRPTSEAGIPVVVLDFNREPAPNVALRNLRLSRAAPVAGVPVQVSVEVTNTSGVPQQKHLELHVDGTREAVSPALTLAPGATLQQEFRFTVDRPGIHQGEVRLAEEDASPLDNRLFFALTANQQIPVAIVKPMRQEIAYAEDTYYLERALAFSGGELGDRGAVRATILTAEELASELLASQAVIFCVNLPALAPQTAERLRAYVRAGGHVVWICGRNTVPNAYNRMNDGVQGELLPLSLGDLRQPGPGGPESWRLGFLEKAHPALTPLVEPASLYQSVLVYKHFALNWTADSGSRVLARLDDGQPLLVERPIGAGSVLLLGTGAHVEWTNLPLKPLFLPLFARLTFHLAQAEEERAQLQAGMPFTATLGDWATGRPGPTAEIEVLRPSGETLRLHPKEGLFRYADTHDVGVYLLNLRGTNQPKQWAFAVNPDSDESDPATLTHDELKARFGAAPLVVCDDPDELGGAVRQLREGKSLREWFLAAVLLGLVFEALLANRRAGLPPAPSQPKLVPSGPSAETASYFESLAEK
jgi:hypothetical protein